MALYVRCLQQIFLLSVYLFLILFWSFYFRTWIELGAAPYYGHPDSGTLPSTPHRYAVFLSLFSVFVALFTLPIALAIRQWAKEEWKVNGWYLIASLTGLWLFCLTAQTSAGAGADLFDHTALLH